MTIEIRVSSEEETDRFARALANALPDAAVVSLLGALGAGKTRLVRGVVQAVGGTRESVGSPTFVLVKEYACEERQIYHFDAYRLRDSDEFLALGAEEYFDADAWSFVEWADRVEDVMPRTRLEIEIEIVDENARRVRIEPKGDFDPDFERKFRDAWGRDVE